MNVVRFDGLTVRKIRMVFLAAMRIFLAVFSVAAGFGSLAQANPTAQLGFGRAPAQVLPQEVQRDGNKVSWRMSDPFRLPNATVTFAPGEANPVYYLKLPGGKIIDLPPMKRVDVSGLTRQQVATAAEDTRFVLEGFSRLLLSRRPNSFAIVYDSYATTMNVDLSKFDVPVRTFDPLVEALEEKPLGVESTDVFSRARADLADAVWPEVPPREIVRVQNSRPRQTPLDRLRNILIFARDAIYTSTLKAGREHRAAGESLKGRPKEYGIQFGFKFESQVGMGRLNFTRNFPVSISIGYSTRERTIVVRRGYRIEKMSDGVGISPAAGKLEFKGYVLDPDAANAADPRQDYAKVTGKSWYPPSIPIFSPVADSAPGYQSRGFAIGFGIQNLVFPQTVWLEVPLALLNTVTEFEETQKRVFTSKQIPDPAVFVKRVQAKINDSTARLSGKRTRFDLRCEALFVD